MNGCIIKWGIDVFILIASFGDIFKDSRVCRQANGLFLSSISTGCFGLGKGTQFLIWCNGNGAGRKRNWTTTNLQPEQQDESLHLIIWKTYWDCLACFTLHTLLHTLHLLLLLKLPCSWQIWSERPANQLPFYSIYQSFSGFLEIGSFQISTNSFLIVIKMSAACIAWENQAWWLLA